MKKCETFDDPIRAILICEAEGEKPECLVFRHLEMVPAEFYQEIHDRICGFIYRRMGWKFNITILISDVLFCYLKDKGLINHVPSKDEEVLILMLESTERDIDLYTKVKVMPQHWFDFFDIEEGNED